MTRPALSERDLLLVLTPLAEAPRWWLAYSGGLDSTVLLHLLARLVASHPDLPPLGALHINHQLQPGADSWQQFCEAQCRALGIHCHSRRVAVTDDGSGPEAAARRARHAVFEDCLGVGDILLTAHHRDDQVETVFLRLLRGAGVDGLAAMAAERPLGRGRLFRPLLDYPREALADYAREHHLEHIEDPSNSDTRLDRNYLRREVLPLLAGRWPGYRQTVSRAAVQMREAATQLREQVPPVPPRRSALGDPGLDLDALRSLPEPGAALALRAWLERLGAEAPDRVKLAEFLRQLRKGEGGLRARLDCGSLSLQRYRDGVYLRPGPPDWEPPAAGLSLAPGELQSFPGVGTLAVLPAEGLGPALALEPGESLAVRWREGGERCQPAGRGGSRPLKKLLQDMGVPPWWRARVPLLYLGEELLAVGDLWLCQSARLARQGDDGRGRWQVRWERNTSAVRD